MKEGDSRAERKNEKDGEELVVEGGAKYVLQTADAPVVQQVTLPTTTQLLRTTEYADGKATKDFIPNLEMELLPSSKQKTMSDIMTTTLLMLPLCNILR